MKSIAFASLLAAVSICYAADGNGNNEVNSKEAKMQYCAFSSNFYSIAASRRDSGISPQDTFQILDQQKKISSSALKKIINQVYFDPNFQHAGGNALQEQMMNLCMNGPNDWKPLK